MLPHDDTALRPDQPHVGEVRANHRFDQARLELWLAKSIDGFRPPLDVRQFNRGASNPTFLTTPDARYVLRKKPPGRLLPSATKWTGSFG
ncbi:MAG: hypothetical protein H0X27_02215 [Caulobacteraceae bacterium]|nr:hypothetical protein [Caulobacteraceae bacterium]